MQTLQPKTVFLRLNLNQTNNIVDGLYKKRDDIEAESLPLYDSDFQDVIDQLSSQGIEIMMNDQESPEAVNMEFVKASQIMRELRKWTNDLSIDPHELRLLNEKLGELNTVLFGE